MSRYFFYKPEPLENEIKEWLAHNFDLSEIYQTNSHYPVFFDKIVPAFQAYLEKLNSSYKKKLLESSFITPLNKLTGPGTLYLLYLARTA